MKRSEDRLIVSCGKACDRVKTPMTGNKLHRKRSVELIEHAVDAVHAGLAFEGSRTRLCVPSGLADSSAQILNDVANRWGSRLTSYDIAEDIIVDCLRALRLSEMAVISDNNEWRMSTGDVIQYRQ